MAGDDANVAVPDAPGSGIPVAEPQGTPAADKPAADTPNIEEAPNKSEGFINAGDTDNSDSEAPAYAEFTLPDEMEMNAGLLEQAMPVFAEQGLSQDQAQAIISLWSEIEQGRPVEQQLAMEDQRQLDEQTIANDPVLGGASLDGNKASVARVMAYPGGDKVVELLAQRGLISNPIMFSFLTGLGRTLSEDTIVGGAGAEESGRPADRIFQKTATQT